jgi:hypothetical protein
VKPRAPESRAFPPLTVPRYHRRPSPTLLSLEALIELLNSSNPGTRWNAVQTQLEAVRQGRSDIVEVLIECLANDPVTEVRLAVVDVLAEASHLAEDACRRLRQIHGSEPDPEIRARIEAMLTD